VKDSSWTTRIIAAIVLVLLISLGFFNPVQEQLLRLQIPIQNVFNGFGLWIGSQPLIGHNLESNDSQVNAKSKTKIAELNSENKLLRAELKSRGSDDKIVASGDVIGRSATTLKREIMISIGGDDGVRQGDVVTSQGFLIGRVIKLQPGFSTVQLVSDQSFRLPVSIGSTARSGLLKGDIASAMVVQIPTTDKLEKGEPVFTNDIGNFVPANLPIGRVGSFTQVDSNVFYEARLELGVDAAQIQQVTVIR
jgi:cell shape-determining protein MreC